MDQRMETRLSPFICLLTKTNDCSSRLADPSHNNLA